MVRLIIIREGDTMVLAGRQIPSPLLSRNYVVADVAELAEVPRQTARRWLVNYRGVELDQPLPRDQREPNTIYVLPGAASYLDLFELVAVGRLRRLGARLPETWQFVTVLQEMIGEQFPLAMEAFAERGRDLLRDNHHIAFRSAATGDVWNEALQPFVDSLDYVDGVAVRGWPRGKQGRVVIGPDYGWGWPVIVGTGIRTELVLEQDRAGQDISEICYDYRLTAEQVRAALDYEASRAAA